MVALHIALFVLNDILLVVLKKASDRYVSSKCRSTCCDNICSCCLNYVEQRSRVARERTQSLDAALNKMSEL